ncbi:phage tail protein [Erythrobacter sp.]|uniref:phage tail protein n=1 Tax=Erythrobacter sp. TaxID=1042 RepID=UPI0032EAF8AB
MNKALTAFTGAIAFAASTLPAVPASAQEYYIGQVITVAGNFCPSGTLPADGRLLAISQNTALFSLLGTKYGGDGRKTFALPDLTERLKPAQGEAIRYCVVVAGIYPSRR